MPGLKKKRKVGLPTSAAPSPSNQARWEPGTSLAQSFISTDGHKQQQQPPSTSLKGCNVSDNVRSDATALVLAGLHLELTMGSSQELWLSPPQIHGGLLVQAEQSPRGRVCEHKKG